MKIMHAAIDASDKTQTFQPLQGVGDEAYLAATGNSVLMRKGDVMVNINLGTADNRNEAAKKIASAIAGRL